MKKNSYDVVIVGGGIMGSATAYYLMSQDDRLNIIVVEPDPTYSKASSTLTVGNARIQFSLRENVQISQYTFEVLERFEEEMMVDDNSPNIAYRREGNLFLINQTNRNAAKDAFALQKRLGCKIEWWSLEKIRERYPLFDPKGLFGGSFGPLDGHFDAYAFLMGYKGKARSLGVKYLNDRVVEICTEGSSVTGVSGLPLSPTLLQTTS